MSSNNKKIHINSNYLCLNIYHTLLNRYSIRTSFPLIILTIFIISTPSSPAINPGESSIIKAFELSPADPDLMHFHGLLYFACLGQEKYEEALEAIDKALLLHPDAGHHLGFRAAVLGHMERGPEAQGGTGPVHYSAS